MSVNTQVKAGMYTAEFTKYDNSVTQEFDTLSAAANFLLMGEYNGELAYVKITGPDGADIVVRQHGADYSPLQMLATYDPFKQEAADYGDDE